MFLPFGVSELYGWPFQAPEYDLAGRRPCKGDVVVDKLHDERDFEQGVMVDVGPGAGALVIFTPEALRGQEIEISPEADDGQRVHTDVLRRKTVGGHLYAAVFGSLLEGDYRLWHETLTTPTHVRIVGGQVTEVDWR